MDVVWFVICVITMLLIFGVIWAIQNGLINVVRPEVSMAGAVVFMQRRKKGMEVDMAKTVIFALITVAIAIALYAILDPKALSFINNMPRLV